MAGAFLDTGAWIGLLDSRDQYHDQARRVFRTLNRTRLVTSNYVLSETLTWFSRHRAQHLSRQLREMIQAGVQASSLLLLWVDPPAHELAWDLFENSGDRELSFCDCSTAVLCRRQPIDFIFAFDSDFRDLGFEVRP